MIRLRHIVLAVTLAVAPASQAAAEGLLSGPLPYGGPLSGRLSTSLNAFAQIDGPRRDRARVQAEDGQRVSLGEIVRNVQSGRDGRMLGVRPQGDTYVVRWEYPGGRIVDITVDARTGRIIGER